jgi:hypothetical protein
MTLYMDCEGAKKMIQNWTTKGRTKHIDVRYHFIRELHENKTLEVKHISGDDNPADLLTKNVAESLFLKHKSQLVCSDTVQTVSSGEDVREIENSDTNDTHD